MSNPANPLSAFNVYECKHVLLAFDNTTAACAYRPESDTLGQCGDEVKVPLGKCYVVVNELEDKLFMIKYLEWSFDFFSPTSASTSISTGRLTLAEMHGNMFPNHLREIAKKLKCAETGITFHLTTYFRGRYLTGTHYESITTKPLIFSVLDVTTGARSGVVGLFTLNFASLYNTMGQLPSISQLNQFTITNSEHSPGSSPPNTAGSTFEILSRKEEEQIKKNPRAERMKMSAPMRTLKELFSGFESELKSSKFEHKRQLQDFIGIYSPDAVKKIKSPTQKKGGGNGIPVDYEVILEKVYTEHPVDNRNLAFEQVEQSQLRPGITSLTVPPGSTIVSAIDTLMKTSKAVATDVDSGYSFKSVITTVLDAEGIVKNTINIRRFQIPHNEMGVKDTGDNKDGLVKAPLVFSLGTGTETDLDILTYDYASGPAVKLSVLEEDEDNMEGATVVLGDRESISLERAATVDFKRSGFSGLRTGTDPVNSGLESGISGVKIDMSKNRFTTAQGSLTLIKILGNSDLYSDLARNPAMVAAGKDDGAILYKFPEYYPMYVKLDILVGTNLTKDDTNYFYHTYHYHLSGVTNHITDGRFTQTLRLLSTDDIT